MKSAKRALRTVSFCAALLTAGAPLAMQSAVTLTAFADDNYTEGSNSDFAYRKYSDHVVITQAKSDPASLTIPSSIDGVPVTEIGIYACQFMSMSSLTLPDTLTDIGHYCFSYCENLTEVTLPASLKTMGIRTFEECPKLSTVNFPDSLVQTGELSFENTPWLTAQRQKDPLVIVNGALIDARTASGDVVVPSSVKYVAGSAFAGSGMEPNTKLTSVVLPASVTEIQYDTFWYCKNLKSAELKGCTQLPFGVFGSCNSLTDLKLSGNLKKIEYGAFADSTATATITFYGTESAWNQVEKPSDDAFLQRAHMVFDPSHVEDPPEPEEVIGDINKDGKCDLTDAKLLQQWLLDGTTELADREAADLNGDRRLNAVDLTLLKQIIL